MPLMLAFGATFIFPDGVGAPAYKFFRGAEIAGGTAPDFTLIGARQSIGAGTLTNTPENIARFIRSP
jgi:cytochrome c oxidase subunit 2